MNGTVSNARNCVAASSRFCSAVSVVSIHAVRIDSISGSVGQPNQALSPFPRMLVAKIGSRYSAAGAPRGNIDQPPLSSGALLVRRSTMVPQSVDCSSMFKPTSRKAAIATELMAS